MNLVVKDSIFLGWKVTACLTEELRPSRKTGLCKVFQWPRGRAKKAGGVTFLSKCY